MFRASGVIVLAFLVLAGCGKRETAAEQRQREAVDLCYKGADRLKAKDNVEAESLFKRALEVDPFCEKAREALASIEDRRRANIQAAKTQVGLIETAVQTYESSVNSYPSSLQALRSQPQGLPDPSKWAGPYLFHDIPKDPWGNPYQYAVQGTHNPKSFDVWSFGPDGVNGTQDDIGNWQEP